MKIKKFPIFYIFLLALVVLTVIFTEFGKSYLTDVLEEYENSQYKYVAEEVLENNFNSGNGEALYQLFKAQISEIETPERVKAYFDELKGENSFSLQSLDKQIEYAVKCGDKRFATLTFDKSGAKTEKGFDLYELKNAKLSEKLFIERSVMVPSGFSLYANGVLIGEEYFSGETVITTYDDELPCNLLGIEYKTYVLSGLLGEPQIEVKSPAGNAAEVVLLENGSYFANMTFDKSISAELSDYVIAATEAYACYLQKDANFGKVAKYLDSSSKLYHSIRTSPNWMVIDHNSYSFEDAEVTEYYEYDENSFACRVKLTHVLKYRGLQDYRDYIDITWYLKKINGKFLIYDSFNNN